MYSSRSYFTRSKRSGLQFACISTFALFLSILLLAISPRAASAHAEYESSDPGANAMLTKVPSTVTVTFAENVNPEGSAITIYDVSGKKVSGDAQVDKAEQKKMSVPLMPQGTSEVYVVVWRTTSAVEGHSSSGSFRFFVNISPMLKGMVQGGGEHMSGSSMSGSSSTTQSMANTGGIPGWSAALIGMVGLLVGGGVGFVLARQQKRQ